MIFLQNPHHEQLAEQIRHWQAAQTENGYGWLLDGSQLSDKEKQWLRRHAPAWQRALDHTEMSALGDYGPLLWLQPEQDMDWWPQWLAQCSGRPLLSIVEYHGAPPDHELWYWLSNLHTDDGSEFQLRFADSHTLANVLPLLTPAQLGHLARHLCRWGWVARDGQWQSFQLPAATAALATLQFDDAQFNAMMQHAQADMLLAEIQDYHIAPPAGHSMLQLHARLEYLQQTMAAYGINDTDSQVLFVTMAFEEGDHFHLDPVYHEHWVQTRAGHTWHSLIQRAAP